MVTLLEKARGYSLRAVACYGKEDTFLVWSGCLRENQMAPLEVRETTPDSCSCGELNLKGNCVHMGFVRELIARDIPARNPVWIEDVKREQAPPKWPADGRTHSAYHGVSWCLTLGPTERVAVAIAEKCHKKGSQPAGFTSGRLASLCSTDVFEEVVRPCAELLQHFPEGRCEWRQIV
jgi:hypothetical protein